MPRVLCSLPHASERINGVAFAPAEGGMLSEEVSEDVALGFALIPGYHLVESAPPATPAAAPASDAEGSEAAAPHTKPSRRRA